MSMARGVMPAHRSSSLQVLYVKMNIKLVRKKKEKATYLGPKRHNVLLGPCSPIPPLSLSFIPPPSLLFIRTHCHLS